MRIISIIVAIGTCVLSSWARAQDGCGVPSAITDQWVVAEPESVGLASATLCPMLKWLNASKESNVHAVLVVRHGTLVFEHYFSGSDEAWGRPIGKIAFGPEVRHDERSATKSVIALLLGIAIDRGLIKGIDEPVLSFFPEYADLRAPEKDRITLRHLVTMSAGLEWHEIDVPYTSADNSEIRMELSGDPYRFTLGQPVVAPAGDVWNYNSGGTEVVAAVLKKVTGKPVDDFARDLLFQPSASRTWNGPEMRTAMSSPRAPCACALEISLRSASSSCSVVTGKVRRSSRPSGSSPRRCRRLTA